MAVAQLKLAETTGAAMDTPVAQPFWRKGSLPLRVGVAVGGIFAFILVVVGLIAGDGLRTLRVPAAQLTIAPVAQGVFHDIIPLRTKVVPRDTIYLDAIEGGRVERVIVEPGFLELYGLQPVAGRFLERDRRADMLAVGEDTRNPPIVINETAVRKLGFASPADAVGQFVSWVRVLDYSGRMGERLPSEIIGVAPDFALRSVRQEVEPTFFFANPGWFSNASVSLEGATIPETLAAMDRAWQETGAARPINRVFLDQRMQQLYADITRASAMLAVFAGITILISCFGLLGLSALVAERRTKEIGIRKAMGASKGDLLRLLLWEFTKPVLWANAIAWPLTYFIVSRWLEGFAYHISPSPWMFLAASGLALLIAVLTVIGHTLLVARAQPVTALRYE